MVRRTDDVTTQFWQLCCITPGSSGAGYRLQTLLAAQAFLDGLPQLDQVFVAEDVRSLDNLLLETFNGDRAHISLQQQAQAGLCLRCRMSYPILRACIKLANLFGAANEFSYRDLLPFVLTDDGRQWIVPGAVGGSEEEAYWAVNDAGEAEKLVYVCFSLAALRSYRVDRAERLSLPNWIYLQTKQHRDLKNYLAEFGFQALSDWALLNRVRSQQLEQLSAQEKALVGVFHAVYRRDRRLKAAVNRCPMPTSAQLSEMKALLGTETRSLNSKPSECTLSEKELSEKELSEKELSEKELSEKELSEKELLGAFKRIAERLRQFDVWRSRQPLEHFDAHSGEYQPRKDLPATDISAEDSEEAELLALLHQQLSLALQQSIQTALTAKIAKLQKSKRYRPFADKFVIGLQHYYQEGLSLKEIVPLLGMSSWDQARRILNPGDFLSQVRQLTLQQLIAYSLTIVQQKGILSGSPSPDYIQQLSEQLEAFADREVFQAAAAEMKAGSHRKFDSAYAQTLLTVLETVHLPAPF